MLLSIVLVYVGAWVVRINPPATSHQPELLRWALGIFLVGDDALLWVTKDQIYSFILWAIPKGRQTYSSSAQKRSPFSSLPPHANAMQTLLFLFIASSSAWSSQATESRISTRFTFRRPEAHNIRSILFGDSFDNDSNLSRHFNHGECLYVDVLCSFSY